MADSADSTSPPAGALAGMTVGKYRVTALLGVGGMGEVYLAEHVRLGQEVALKVLHPQVAERAEMVARFASEAREVARLGHQNIVSVFDFGDLADGRSYYVMERLNGRDLFRELGARGVLPWAEALGIVRQVAAALAVAHDAGIIHRDLKPDNLFLVAQVGSAQPIVKVLDFGVAKLWRDGLQGPSTQAGVILGTPDYISPEQGRGSAQVDGRSDLYSLGVVLFQMLTGTVPFIGEPGEVVARHILDPIPAVRDRAPGVPEAVARLVARLVAKNPADRTQTAELLVEAIDRILAHGGLAAEDGAPRARTLLGLGPRVVPLAATPGPRVAAQHPGAAPATLANGELVTATARALARRWAVMLTAAALAALAAAAGGAWLWRSGDRDPALGAATTTPAPAISTAAAVAPTAAAAPESAPSNAETAAAAGAGAPSSAAAEKRPAKARVVSKGKSKDKDKGKAESSDGLLRPGF